MLKADLDTLREAERHTMIDGVTDAAVKLIAEWYEREPEAHRSRIGIPNTGLHVLEVFRVYWPLRESQYLTAGGGQVSGLSGPSGDAIAGRYVASLPSMGTEAGRTSRSTPSAARRLAERLNHLPPGLGQGPETRAAMADVMQRWIVEHVLVPEFRRARPTLRWGEREGLGSALRRYVAAAAEDEPWTHVALRLTAAVLSNLSDEFRPQIRTTVGRRSDDGDVWIGDVVVLISALPAYEDMALCRQALAGGRGCLLLVPADRVAASAQLLAAAGIDDTEVQALDAFLGGLVAVAARFDDRQARELIANVAASLNEA
ncbi:MAG: DUF4928 family protein [Rhodoglobus sp.]|nr:DUF4928 family protein [Rhodoglobus sp.]